MNAERPRNRLENSAEVCPIAKVFLSAELFPCILVLALQALTTIALIKILNSFGANNSSKVEALVTMLLLFCFDLSLSAIGGYLSAKWAVKNERTYLNKLFGNIAGQPQLYTNRDRRDAFTAAALNPGSQLVYGLTDYFFQLAKALTLSVSGIIGFSIEIDSRLSDAFIVAVIISASVIYCSFQKIAQHNLRRSLMQGRVSSVLAKTWGNLTIGNTVNEIVWRRAFARAFDRYQARTVSSTAVSVVAHLTLGLVVTVVPLGTLIYLIVIGASAPGTLLTLPKLLDNSKALMSLSSYLTSFGTASAHLKVIRRNISAASVPISDAFINYDLLEPRLGNSIEAIQSRLPAKGRISIHGPNGSGKTLLLTLLKDRFKERALSLPANADLMFNGTCRTESVGEAAMRLLRMATLSDTPILLLDEWDANLDASNMQIGSNWIDGFVDAGGLVIEVRHRTSLSLDETL